MNFRWLQRRAEPPASAAERTPEQIELDAIAAQERGFAQLATATLVVGFVHMFWTLKAFSGEGLLEQIAAIFQTAIIDYATWRLMSYRHYAKVRGLTRNRWVSWFFYTALTLSYSLNAVYLWLHSPTTLHAAVNVVVTITVAGFIAMSVGVSSLIRGELEGDRQEQEIKMAKQAQRVRITVIRPPQRHKGSLPVSSNGKAALNADDVDAMLSLLRQKQVSYFNSVEALRKELGFASPSSGTKVYKALDAAGRITLDANKGFHVDIA